MTTNKEILVRVHCGWQGDNTMLRQTPNQDGVWDNIRFVIDGVNDGGQPLEECDYFLVYNWTLRQITVHCPKGNKWIISGEPPIHTNKFAIKAYPQYDKLLTQHQEKLGKDHVHVQGAIPWFVKKSYTELLALPDNAAQKKNAVSCITSNLTWKPGHAERLALLDALQGLGFEVETYGRGIRPLPNDDKFEILYPFKYSIAIENSYYDHYWTEKIADCFLSWTMPIYAGAPNITDYFPKEAMILIDPKKPKEAMEIIKEAIENKAWEKNRDAIKEARALILNKYQFFPLIANQIQQHIAAGKAGNSPQKSTLAYHAAPWHEGYQPSLYRKIEYRVRKLLDIKPY